MDAAYSDAAHDIMDTQGNLGLRARTASAIGISCAIHLAFATALFLARSHKGAAENRAAAIDLMVVDVPAPPRPPEPLVSDRVPAMVASKRPSGKPKGTRAASAPQVSEVPVGAQTASVDLQPSASPEAVVLPDEPDPPKSDSTPPAISANSTGPAAQGRGSSDRTEDVSDGAHGKPGDADWESIRASTYQKLSYPSLARRMGWAGQVVLRFRVNPAGKVLSETILVSSGFAILDESALDALKRAAPFPTRGRDLDIILPVVFALH